MSEDSRNAGGMDLRAAEEGREGRPGEKVKTKGTRHSSYLTLPIPVYCTIIKKNP